MQSWAERFSRFFIRHRHINLTIILAITAFFGYHALQLQVFSQFIDLLPRNHPYIEVYEKYNRQYGGANVVYAAIVAKDGKQVYDERFLEKLYGFTDQVDKIEGVDHGQIQSLTHISVRDQRIDREGVLSTPQMVGSEAIVLLETQFHTRRLLRYAKSVGSELPGDVAGLIELSKRIRTGLQDQLAPYGAMPVSQIEDRAAAEQVREWRRLGAEVDLLLLRLEGLPEGYALQGEELVLPQGGLLPPKTLDGLSDRVHQSRYVYGRLISRDDSAALISAGFVEGRLDYKRIFDELFAIKAELEADGSVEIHLTGQPVLVGWTFAFLGEILLVLGCSILVLIILPWLYFRHWYGIALPLSGATMSAIWGLGYTSLMGYQLEPLVLVIPMLITARAVSHSVQFVERFYEEYERLGDKEEAVVSSMAELLLPGGLGIITDAIGIVVIYVSSIALMKKVALIGTVWAVSILVTEMLLNRLMIMYFPAPKNTEHYVPKPIAAALDFIARIATDVRMARITAVVWVAVVIGCSFVALKVGIGESRPGTPILYPDHQFNQSTGVIASKFYGADELTVVVETELEGGVHRPEVMADIEAFQRYMEEDPKVGGTVSIVDFMKQINRVYHNADPRWSTVPYRAEEIGGLLYLYEASAPDPRVLQPVRDQTAQTAAVRIFYADHQGETIRHALERARAFMAARPGGPIAIRSVTAEGDFLADLHWWLGPLIPPRRPELTVLVRGDDGSYASQAVQEPGRMEPAPADSAKRIMTLPRITKPLHKNLVTAGYDSVQKLADADIEELAKVDGFDLVTAYALIQAAELDRRSYRVVQEWQDEGAGVAAQLRKRGLYEPYELWVRYQSDDWTRRESGEWATGTSWALASGLMGVLAASNDEVEGSNNATLIASFATTFLMILFAYRSLAAALLLIVSLGTATLISLAYMYFAGIGFDVNTLPVQALGVGVGVDYALYIMDRVVRERQRGHDREESIRIAIKTTGMAVFFTGTTLVGGIIFWYFLSSLRFSADMSLLLSIILTGNLIGAVLLVPSLATLFRPSFAVVGVPEKPALATEGDRNEGSRRGPGAMPDPRRV